MFVGGRIKRHWQDDPIRLLMSQGQLVEPVAPCKVGHHVSKASINCKLLILLAATGAVFGLSFGGNAGGKPSDLESGAGRLR
jgi:hypothetical protein